MDAVAKIHGSYSANLTPDNAIGRSKGYMEQHFAQR